jgi:hypothetical protein
MGYELQAFFTKDCKKLKNSQPPSLLFGWGN